MCFIALGPLFYESAIISFLLGALFIVVYSVYRPFQWVEPFYIQGQRRTEQVKNLLSLSELLPAVALLVIINLAVYSAITLLIGQVFSSGYSEYTDVFTSKFLDNIKDGCNLESLDDRRIVDWYLPMYASIAMIGALPVVFELKFKNFDLSKVKTDQICQSLVGVREKLPRILNVVSNSKLKVGTIPKPMREDEEYKRILFCKTLLKLARDRSEYLKSKDKSYINILNRSDLMVELLENIRAAHTADDFDNSEILDLLEKDSLRVSSVSLCKSTPLKDVEAVLGVYNIKVSEDFDGGEWRSIDHFVMISFIACLFISFCTLVPPLVFGFVSSDYKFPWDVSDYFPAYFVTGISLLLTWAATYVVGFGIVWWLRGAMDAKSWFARKQFDGSQKYVRPSPFIYAIALFFIYLSCLISMSSVTLLLQWSAIDEALVIRTLKESSIFCLPASTVIFLTLSFADTAILKPSTSMGRRVLDVVLPVIVVILVTLISNALVFNYIQNENLAKFTDFLLYVVFINVTLLSVFWLYFRVVFKSVKLK